MKLSEELQWRGFINQTTFDDLSDLDAAPRTFYHGFDASADSQTIGNLAAMMFDMVFMRHGYKAVLVAGGATSLIGDPGGKDSERPLQNEETIHHNVERARAQLEGIFRGHDFRLVNNLDWTKDMTVIEFLRGIGKYYGMTSLISRDYIASRIGESGGGISYTEFSYALLQGMDYLHLYDTYGVTLQLGGSDQWGNCLSGVELIRKARGKTVDVITLPLIINKATGKKFGKSEEGAVWLDEQKTSVYKFYQFWLNADDAGVIDYLKVYTTLSKNEIDMIESRHKENPSARLAQTTLAREVTELVHGKERTDSVARVTRVLFSEESIGTLNDTDWNELSREVPTIPAGCTVVEALTQGGIAASHGAARRLIKAGAVSLNGQKITEDQAVAARTLVKKGKNSFVLVK